MVATVQKIEGTILYPQNRLKKLVPLISIMILSAPGCKAPQSQDQLELTKYSILSDKPEKMTGCKSMMDNYCSHLYSPDAGGNLIIDDQMPIQILEGETKNQLPHVFVRYSLAKIRNQNKLPHDFREKLNEYDYFERLNEYIHRPPITKMTLAERSQTEHLSYELDSIWQSSIDETIIARMNRKFPGFYNIPDRSMPIEYDVERKRVRRRLISEISKILWREDSNWIKVENTFAALKISFAHLISSLDLPSDLKVEWKRKISTVKLVPPGSLPEISDEECSTTTQNAYYYSYLNIITVCAGDFNSEDVLLTLAHEMAHALDIDRDRYVFLQHSEVGARLRNLRSDICESKKPIDCETWRATKEWLPSGLAALGTYRPPLPEFNKCLKRSATRTVATQSDFTRIAETAVRNQISNLASNDVFLRLIESKIPMRNGILEKNPNYMNPCEYYLWSKEEEPIEDELYTLIYFTAEYECSTGEQDDRLKNSIESARKVSSEILRTVMELEGEFSSRTELVSEGLSSSPSERFADVVGSYVVSDYLKNYSALWERRGKYLATASWLCTEPSLAASYPEQAKVERQFDLESHGSEEARKMDIFSEPIRQTLMCQKDFSFDECKLPTERSNEINLKLAGHP